MSHAVVEDVAASWESYQLAAADLEERKPEGLLLHAAGPTDEGVRIVEVWESEEAWHRYADEAERAGQSRFGDAPRYLRAFRPTRLVIASDTSSHTNEGGRPCAGS